MFYGIFLNNEKLPTKRNIIKIKLKFQSKSCKLQPCLYKKLYVLCTKKKLVLKSSGSSSLRPWSSNYPRTDRARSVVQLLDTDSSSSASGAYSRPARSNYITRNSVGRYNDDYYPESTPSYSTLRTSRARTNDNNHHTTTVPTIITPSTKKSQTPEFDKRSEIEKRISLASESSVTATPETLD